MRKHGTPPHRSSPCPTARTRFRLRASRRFSSRGFAMHRREFLAACAAGAAATLPLKAQAQESANKTERRPFALRYAPHFGMFRQLGGADLVDQLKFAADQGFQAWEDNE